MNGLKFMLSEFDLSKPECGNSEAFELNGNNSWVWWNRPIGQENMQLAFSEFSQSKSKILSTALTRLRETNTSFSQPVWMGSVDFVYLP